MVDCLESASNHVQEALPAAGDGSRYLPPHAAESGFVSLSWERERQTKRAALTSLTAHSKGHRHHSALQ